MIDNLLSDYRQVVKPNPRTIAVQAVWSELERAKWALVEARRAKNSYLAAYLISHERYHRAKRAKDGGATLLQAEAMVKFCDQAMHASQVAAIKRYEFQQLALAQLKNEQGRERAELEQKFVSYLQNLQSDVGMAKLRNALLRVNKSEARTSTYLKRIGSLTPQALEEMLAALQYQLEAVSLVREELSSSAANVSWPEPININAWEELQRRSRRLLEKVIHTRINLSVGLNGKAPLSWWAVRLGSPPRLSKKSAFKGLNSDSLAPGAYDIYIVQDQESLNRPIPLALRIVNGIQVEEGKPTEVHLHTGLGLSLADGFPRPSYWFVMPSNASATAIVAQRAEGSLDPLWLAPGNYDVYWAQDYEHRENPSLVANTVTVPDEGIVTVALNSGIRLEVADWVPKRATNNAWWGATLTGQPPDQRVNWSNSNDSLLLAPGQYDVYWTQDWEHQDKPLPLARGVEVKDDTLITVPAKSGIKLKVPANTPALDANNGWWGITTEGGKDDQLIHFAKGQFDQPLLVPPGTYDIVWKQDGNHQPIKIKQGVVVQDNILLEVDAQLR